jgi:hypothetical protein
VILRSAAAANSAIKLHNEWDWTAMNRLLALCLCLLGFALSGTAAHAACMVRPLSDVAQVPKEKVGQPFYILVSDADAKEFADQGFAPSDCPRELADPAGQERFRDEVCKMASFGNSAVQWQFTAALGTRPGAICRAASAVAGKSEVTDEVSAREKKFAEELAFAQPSGVSAATISALAAKVPEKIGVSGSIGAQGDGTTP